MDPGLRGDDLPLDAGQEPLALGQGQAQGGQIGEVVGPGDPHDVGAAFFPFSSDAHQLHDPDHVASASQRENGPENTSFGLAPPISRQSLGSAAKAAQAEGSAPGGQRTYSR